MGNEYGGLEKLATISTDEHHTNSAFDPLIGDRAERRRIMNDHLLNMSPAQRDPRMQAHLTQTRGKE
ncbi:MAG: hypothetical protein J5J06_13485 [Phycisphaerae bacterium]|nr:hypothetical protein [Phycisphaerae bacterium]